MSAGSDAAHQILAVWNVRSLLRSRTPGGQKRSGWGRLFQSPMLMLIWATEFAWRYGKGAADADGTASFLLWLGAIGCLSAFAVLLAEMFMPLAFDVANSTFLETLPLLALGRVLGLLARNLPLALAAWVFLIGFRSVTHEGLAWLPLALLALGQYFNCAFGALGVVALFRWRWPEATFGHGRALLAFALALATAVSSLPLVAFQAVGAHLTWSALWLAIVPLGGAVLIVTAERAGYDRILVAPGPGRVPIQPLIAHSRLKIWRPGWKPTLESLERLLSIREGKRLVGRGLGGLSVFLALVATGIGLAAPKAASILLPGIGAAMACVIGIFSTRLALASVVRDLVARPLIGSLPIVPRDTLAGKTEALRRLVMPLVLCWSPVALLGIAAKTLAPLELLGIAAASFYLLCDAAVSVAFLTRGLGGLQVPSVDLLTLQAQRLLWLPLLAALLAPHPLAALPPLIALGALAVQARRAASQCTSWGDDLDPGTGPDNPVWRALLVFSGFATVQVFSSVLLIGVSPAWGLSLAYAVAALFLVVLTRRRGSNLPAISWRPSAVGIPLGLLAGMATAGFAVFYVRHLSSFFELAERGSPQALVRTGDWASRIVLVATLVVAAPLAEEFFFRGWLQQAVGLELPANRKRWAIVIAAFGFAVVHPPLSFGPVFLVGLLSGVLFAWTGSLLPGVLAHATHNALVLWWTP